VKIISQRATKHTSNQILSGKKITNNLLSLMLGYYREYIEMILFEKIDIKKIIDNNDNLFLLYSKFFNELD